MKWSTLATVSLTLSAGPAGMTTASAVLLKRSHFSLLAGKSLKSLLARCGNVPRRFNIGLERVQRDVGVPPSGVTRTGRSTAYWTTEVILDVSLNDAASRSPWVAHNELHACAPFNAVRNGGDVDVRLRLVYQAFRRVRASPAAEPATTRPRSSHRSPGMRSIFVTDNPMVSEALVRWPALEGTIFVRDDVRILERSIEERLRQTLADPVVGVVRLIGGRGRRVTSWWTTTELYGHGEYATHADDFSRR